MSNGKESRIQISSVWSCKVAIGDRRTTGSTRGYLSFANHSTYDHNTKQSVDEYFKKCYKYVKDGGILLFESHHPNYETPERLENVLEVLKRYFDVERICKLTRGSSGDHGRIFAIGRFNLEVQPP